MDSGIQIPAASHKPARHGSISHTLAETEEPQAGVLDTLTSPAPLQSPDHDLEAAKPNNEQWLTRRPPEKPILRPETRYCFTEGFTKPVRTHHCRACGTVRLLTTSWHILVLLTAPWDSAFSNMIIIVLGLDNVLGLAITK